MPPSLPRPLDPGVAPASREGDAAGDLRERVKELACLYEVATAFVEHRGSLRECLQRIVAMLPRACRFPERTVASLRLDDLEAISPGHDRADGTDDPQITSALVIAGVNRGHIALRWSGGRPAAGVEPFLAEERSLLDTVARQVGVFVESVEAEQRRSHMEAQLRHTDRLATIGQLAAGVAHELNEPLGNVLGFAQLALKAPGVPEQVRSDLGRIVQASLHGREIIRKLLVFARQAPASKQPTALNAVVEEAMFLLEAGCENGGIRFVRELAVDLPTVDADPVQVRQVVTNLVINAMQAITGAGVITVRTDVDREAIVLAVADTGSGMEPEVLRRVFDPFFTTKDVGQGTGLGLAVVQGIVTGHAGSIEVESKPGRGSEFRVRLPLRPIDRS